MAKKSKSIGKAYERRVAKLLTEFTGVNFRKVPSSGGFNKTGGLVVAERVFCGDVICDREDFLFSVEAKKRDSFSFPALVTTPKTAAFTQWWGQTINDANNNNLLPLLFFKPNNAHDFAAFSDIGMERLGWQDWMTYVSFRFGPDEYEIKLGKNNIIHIMLPTANIIEWKYFVSVIDPHRMFSEWHAAAENRSRSENPR